MEVMEGIETVAGGVKAVVEVLGTVREGALAIQRAHWLRRRLAEQLQEVLNVIEEAKAEYSGRGVPSSAATRVALRNLRKDIANVEGEVTKLRRRVRGLGAEMARMRQGGQADARLVQEGQADANQASCCSISGCCCRLWGVVESCWRALLPPEWVSRIPQVSAGLRAKVQEAKERGVFKFSTTFCEDVPKLYIRPKGRFDEAVGQLRQARRSGVLIWGGKGLGKTSLARDIARAFAFDPDLSEAFPDGVFHMDCGQVDASGIAGMHRALLDKVQGRANQDTEIKGFEAQDKSNQLGNALQGQRCLIWLDNVQEPSLLPACCPADFDGALLVTSNKANACELLPACFSMEMASNLFWAVDEGSGDRIATKILAARAADNRDTETFPPGCEDTAEALLDVCKGSVLALAVIGNHLRGKTSRQDWESVQQSLTERLQDHNRLPGDYPLTVFGALDLALAGLPDDERNVVMAFWQFRPGAALPFPLVKLAVEVETRREWDSASLEFSLEKIVRANLLELWDGAAFVAAAGGKKGYRLLDLVAMWLTEKNKDRIQQPLFQEPPDRADPSGSQDQFTTGLAAFLGRRKVPSAAEERRQKQCSLLAAFLGTFGKVEGSLNVPQQAEHFLDAALDLGLRGWADPSLSSYLQAARLACKIQEGLSARAVIAAILALRGFLKGPTDEALQDLDQADRLQPNDAWTLKHRGATKLDMGRRQEALQDLDQADSLQPNDAWTLKHRGATKRDMGRHQEALQDLDQADRLQPNDAWTLKHRGATKGAMGRHQEALQDLDEADRLQPKNAWTLKERGATKMAMGRHQEALQDLDQADRLQPNNAWTLQHRGATKWLMGRHQEALQDLDQADRLQPNDAWTLKHRGATKWLMGRHQEALQDLDQADRLQPNDAWTLRHRGTTNLRMGRHQEALQDLDQADRLQPNDAWTVQHRGATKMRMGRHQEALQDLDQADRLQPNDAWTFQQRGFTKWLMGRHEEALQDLDQADCLEPKDAFTLTMRGAVQWKRGQLPAALRDLEEALRLSGEDDGDMLALRAAVKLEGGDPEGARQDALRAREALSGLPPHLHLPGSPALCQDVLQRCGGGGEPSPQQTPAVGGVPSPQGKAELQMVGADEVGISRERPSQP
eukprot:jgi/Botrbrau1/20068/Bobra.200_1s0072.1